MRIVFITIAFGTFLYLLLRWLRSKTAFCGNELILHPPVLPILVLLPGGPQVCVMRLAVYSSLFGLFVFWNGMLKRSRRVEVPLFVYTVAGILVFELLVWLFGMGEREHIAGYLFFNFLMWGIFYFYSYRVRICHRAIKCTVTVDKLFEIALVSSPYVVFGGIAMGAAVIFPEWEWLCDVVLLPFLILFMWYLYFNPPICADTKELCNSEKKKGYQTIKTGGYGQVLEDEGCGAVDESVVEDSRIICALMMLFEKEHLYRNVDIKIASVALMVGTNKTYLSRALNTRLSRNFCQFVNYYRIREACTMFIVDPELEMREIAEQCGFSSSSNFSIVFKYNTGFTPGDWCRVIKNKLENEEVVWVDDYLL